MPPSRSSKSRVARISCRVAGALTLMLVVGCGESSASTEPDGELVRDETAHFQTDSLQYGVTRNSREYVTTIEMTYTNRRADSVFVVNCGGSSPVTLERRVGSAWRSAWSPAVPACLSQPIIVPPGGSRRFVLYVGAGVAGSPVEPKWSFDDVDGEYRIVWNQFLSSYREDRQPLGTVNAGEQRVSNRFRLVLRP